MTDYGVQPTGYVRKPIGVILAELEAAMITEFGPGVVQTPQSPFGQLNGLMADLLAEVDERNLDLYQSYDPDQAEGTRLEVLGRLRLLARGTEDDAAFRRSITNEGQARVDIQDLSRALLGLDGVTYARVFVNESGETTNEGLERGFVAAAVIGGDDAEIALNMRRHVVPGINTYGNTYVTSDVDGYCRTVSIIRPVQVPIEVELEVRTAQDKFGCPAPSVTAIRDLLVTQWNATRINGLDPSFYTVRTIVEGAFPNVEVVAFTGSRDDIPGSRNGSVLIGFTEMALFDNLTTSVEAV